MMILQTSFKYCPLYKSSYDRGLYSIEHIELHTFQRCAELKLVGDWSQNFNVGQYDLLTVLLLPMGSKIAKYTENFCQRNPRFYQL